MLHDHHTCIPSLKHVSWPHLHLLRSQPTPSSPHSPHSYIMHTGPFMHPSLRPCVLTLIHVSFTHHSHTLAIVLVFWPSYMCHNYHICVPAIVKASFP